ncbi:hypothetical protein [Streptomyces sp. NPDC053048]|uniref:hypothetical protein n=1 Tax=Streptomyces sp. NPDC053048 TaxID=3365694 RepID=UPI0037D9231F
MPLIALEKESPMPKDLPVLDGQVIIGRPAQGKGLLAPDATPQRYVHQLRRAALKIQQRQADPRAAGSVYIVFADTEDLINRHPDHAELHRLLSDVAAQGPEVDVRLIPPPAM